MSIEIGWSRRDISTERPIILPGQFYIRISEGISDPLYANVLYIGEEGSTDNSTVFVSVDSVYISPELIPEVSERIKAVLPDFPTENIIINATHAHTGANQSDYYDTGVDYNPLLANAPFEIPDVGLMKGREYRLFLADSIADAVVEAYNTREIGGFSYGYGYACVSHSRRVAYFDDLSLREGYHNGMGIDGHVKMYGETNDENFAGYESGDDSFINILYTFNADDELTGAVINVPCPSQNSEAERKLTADYWHDVRVAVRAKFGDIGLISQCAAAGDLSPRILHYKKAQDRRFGLKYGGGEIERNARKDIAERILDAFTEVYSWAKKDITKSAKLCHISTKLPLDCRRVTAEEYAYCKAELAELQKKEFVSGGDPIEDLDYNSTLLTEGVRYSSMINDYESGKREQPMPCDVHIVRLGDIAFCTNTFELYMDYMHRIQARSPFIQTFIVQLVGGAGGGYLATEKGVANKGYSACIFDNNISPKGGQQLVEKTLELLREASK